MSVQELVLEQAEVIQDVKTDETSFTTILRVLNTLINSTVPIKQNEDGKVTFHPSLMNKDQYYPFNFKNKQYLLKKSDNEIIDIYEVKE